MTTVSLRTLYHSVSSPECRKVRLALAEKSLPFNLKEENVWALRDEFLQINLAGTVPVLVEKNEVKPEDAAHIDVSGANEETESGSDTPSNENKSAMQDIIVVGSSTILEYLDEAYPEIALVPGTLADKAEARRLQSWFDDKFDEEVSGPLIFEKIERRKLGMGAPNMQEVRQALEHMSYHLDYVGYLTEDRRWLAGDELSVADLAAAAHLSLLDYLGDVPWHKFDAAKGWYARIKSRPSFRPILGERIAGMPPSRHYTNLDF